MIFYFEVKQIEKRRSRFESTRILVDTFTTLVILCVLWFLTTKSFSWEKQIILVNLIGPNLRPKKHLYRRQRFALTFFYKAVTFTLLNVLNPKFFWIIRCIDEYKISVSIAISNWPLLVLELSSWLNAKSLTFLVFSVVLILFSRPLFLSHRIQYVL